MFILGVVTVTAILSGGVGYWFGNMDGKMTGFIDAVLLEEELANGDRGSQE